MGEIEKLRQAREAMNEIFPLTPKMWQEWARDEASISTGYIFFPFCIGFVFVNNNLFRDMLILIIA